ncbi:MAG: sensor domain-containing protein [Pseudomonadota bacterium]
MRGVLDLVLEVFNADRAWFLYPCEPDAPSWSVPMERTRPEWPGLFAHGGDMPMDSSTSEIFSELLRANSVIQYSSNHDNPVPPQIAERFSVKSQLMIAIRPKIGKAWVFGLHHCDNMVVHDEQDMHLFTAIAHRLSDTLSVLISTRQLRESEKRSQGMADSVIDDAGVLVVVLDKDGRIVRFNRASEKMSGYSYAEVEGKFPWDLLLAPEDADDVRRNAFEALAHNPEVMAGHYTNYWLNKSGERYLIEWANTLLLDAIGNMEFMVSVGTDVTARMRGEEALRESEARFRGIIEATPVPLALNDEQGNITYLNKAFIQTLGYTTDDIPTLADWWPRAYPDPQYRQWVSESWQNNMEEVRRTHKDFVPMELNIKCKDGMARTFMVSAASLKGSIAGTHLVILYKITLRKAAEEEINHLAYFDPLTHLPNRRLLLDRLKQALASSARSGREGALLFIDLDNFKILNDTLGHDTGDLLLQQVAQRLAPCVREGDTVARLGGDEFVVMLESLSEQALVAAAKTQEIGEKILATLNKTYQLGPYESHSTASIGVTLFKGHEQGVDELLKQADIAMYQAKRAGRNTLRFFDPAMQASLAVRAALEGELRKALEKQQFHLYYQIQVDSLRRPLGAEALIRWIHPERGLVSPMQFIPLAEETGLILSIGEWVLETSCAQIKAWQKDALTRDLVLSVNVSARQFRQADFAAQVSDIVQRHAIPPSLLKLELTESLLQEDIEDIIAIMNALNKVGVQFSLDDFGTGYSSLQYLKRLPLDQLKIDQSFIRDIATDSNDETIVRTIITMAHSLDLNVIAEGVETEAQRQFLLQNGCTQYQGYLFSKPVPIGQFEELLKLG